MKLLDIRGCYLSSMSSASIPYIFHCVEWSMGTVIDIYWRYAEAGDHYLGRMLALQNCSISFRGTSLHVVTSFLGQTAFSYSVGTCYTTEKAVA